MTLRDVNETLRDDPATYASAFFVTFVVDFPSIATRITTLVCHCFGAWPVLAQSIGSTDKQ